MRSAASSVLFIRWDSSTDARLFYLPSVRNNVMIGQHMDGRKREEKTDCNCLETQSNDLCNDGRIDYPNQDLLRDGTEIEKAR